MKEQIKPQLFIPSATELTDAAQRLVQQSLCKTITIQATEKEIKALTSVLVDVLDYYSTLPKNEEEMRLLRQTTELSEKINKVFYAEK